MEAGRDHARHLRNVKLWVLWALDEASGPNQKLHRQNPKAEATFKSRYSGLTAPCIAAKQAHCAQPRVASADSAAPVPLSDPSLLPGQGLEPVRAAVLQRKSSRSWRMRCYTTHSIQGSEALLLPALLLERPLPQGSVLAEGSCS